MVASFPTLTAPAPLPRRAVTVFGVASVALACMAAGLGLAFPGGIGSRSGSGTGVSPILVTPARSGASTPAQLVPSPTHATSTNQVPSQLPARPTPTAASASAPTTQTTLPPDVVNQVNQTVSDVLGTLIPPQGGSK